MIYVDRAERVLATRMITCPCGEQWGPNQNQGAWYKGDRWLAKHRQFCTGATTKFVAVNE